MRGYRCIRGRGTVDVKMSNPLYYDIYRDSIFKAIEYHAEGKLFTHSLVEISEKYLKEMDSDYPERIMEIACIRVEVDKIKRANIVSFYTDRLMCSIADWIYGVKSEAKDR